MPVHAFIFPGQGSQSVGMGRDLAAAFAAAREVFGEVDDTLNQKLSKLMFEGPAEELTLTENTQPALMAMSLAVLRVLEAEGGFTLKDTRRGGGRPLAGRIQRAGGGRQPARRRMRPPAAPARRGDAARGAAGRGRDGRPAGHRPGRRPRDLRRGGGQGEVVEAANDNGGGQVVISGHRAAVERAVELAKARGIKRAMLLPVSAPFHCALMAPAADVMRGRAGPGRAGGRPWCR